MRCDTRFGKTEAKLSSHNTPISFEDQFFAPYISGYVDGEGSFCVSICKSKKHRFGWELRPSFSVSQNEDRSEVLYYMKQFFNCGSIRKNISDKTLKYEIRSLADLTNIIIPHFEANPLLSSKQREFILFKEICIYMNNKEHLTKLGFNKILNLISQMSLSNHRKYNPQEIKL